MDGCWNFFLLGCVIDWQAWAAIFTAFAAGVALWVAGSERRARESAEFAESKVMGQVLSHALRDARDRLFTLREGFDLANKSGGDATYFLATDPKRSKELASDIQRASLTEVERLESRLHLLP